VGILGGYAIAAFARAVFIWVLLTAIALAVGMGVGGSAVDMLGLYALAGMVNFAALMWAAGIALRIRSIQAGPLMQTPVFLIIFLAPVYVPIDLLSGWVESAARVNPLTAVIEAGRGFISGAETEVLLAFGAAAGLALLLAVWAVTGLRRAEAAGG
jgi:ABC-type polysaccharide/polyol phosphate export permease